MRTERQILDDIAAFSPRDGVWRPLDELLRELWAVTPTSNALPVLFGVFERFPDEDGAGVLWSIVHGVEHAFSAYEPELRESLARVPSAMGAILLRRLLRSEDCL
jgi:hypothetical protein